MTNGIGIYELLSMVNGGKAMVAMRWLLYPMRVIVCVCVLCVCVCVLWVYNVLNRQNRDGYRAKIHKY